MIKASTYGKGRTALQDALRERLAFNTSGALHAREYPLGECYVDSGRLDGKELDAFKCDRSGITYIVFSYGTPIAWVYDGVVHRVEQKFSPTTSKHQGLLYML